MADEPILSAVTSDLTLQVDGVELSVADDGASLMEVLRDRLGHTTVKDGCSPQGQCGCCTVLVDGRPVQGCRRIRANGPIFGVEAWGVDDLAATKGLSKAVQGLAQQVLADVHGEGLAESGDVLHRRDASEVAVPECNLATRAIPRRQVS